MSTLRSPRPTRATSYRAGMLRMADSLFAEFERLPVRLVLDAIAAAHRSLHESGVVLPSPTQVEALARDILRPRVTAA